MSDDMLLHFSSNSSNQSDNSLPTKIAKLEARMVGKPSSSPSPSQLNPPQQQQLVQPIWPSITSEMPDQSMSSSDSDDDNGGEFLILANTQKRKRQQEDSIGIEHQETHSLADGRKKIGETIESKTSSDTNMRKQGRGRGPSTSGRGRGLKGNEQARTQISVSTSMPSNGQHENSVNKDYMSKEHFQNVDHTSLEEEVVELREKVVALEEDHRKCRQESSDNYNQLERKLKELKDHEQQMKPKRLKIISDLLISVSKAERQEARMKIRQDSLRLGNVGVIRAGTVISERWEDGQVLKDLNIHLIKLRGQMQNLVHTKMISSSSRMRYLNLV